MTVSPAPLREETNATSFPEETNATPPPEEAEGRLEGRLQYFAPLPEEAAERPSRREPLKGPSA